MLHPVWKPHPVILRLCHVTHSISMMSCGGHDEGVGEVAHLRDGFELPGSRGGSSLVHASLRDVVHIHPTVRVKGISDWASWETAVSPKGRLGCVFACQNRCVSALTVFETL